MTDEPTDPPTEEEPPPPPPVVPLVIYCAVCGKVLINEGPRYTHGSKKEDRDHTPEPTTTPGGGGGSGSAGRNT